jgi:hypothetical protein
MGHLDIVRELLAAGANKRHVQNDGQTAESLVSQGFGADMDNWWDAPPTADIRALLAAAP